MHLAYAGLENTTKYKKHITTLIGCIFNIFRTDVFVGKKACGVQRARQGLLNSNSGKQQSQMNKFHIKSDQQLCIKHGFGIKEPRGLRKTNTVFREVAR